MSAQITLAYEAAGRDHKITWESSPDLLHSRPWTAPMIERVLPNLYQWAHFYRCTVYTVLLPNTNVSMCVCICVGSLGCLIVWKANGASGDQSISPLALVKKPTATALLTALILPLSIDMDQETVSLSIAFCLTICNINKNSTFIYIQAWQTPHTALPSACT